MTSATARVRLSPAASMVLERLSTRMGRPKSSVLEEALRVLDEKTFAVDVQAGYRRLQADEEAWKDYLADTEIWDRLATPVLNCPVKALQPSAQVLQREARQLAASPHVGLGVQLLQVGCYDAFAQFQALVHLLQQGPDLPQRVGGILRFAQFYQDRGQPPAGEGEDLSVSPRSKSPKGRAECRSVRRDKPASRGTSDGKPYAIHQEQA